MIGAVLALIFLAVWGVFALLRLKGRDTATIREGSHEEALAAFVERSLVLASLPDVLAEAAATARVAFGARRVVLFEPASKEGSWDALLASETTLSPLEPVPDASKGVFGWIKHNPDVIVLDDVSGPRYGAMRVPLGDLKTRYQIDAIVPMVERGHTIAALGLGLGRRPTAHERSLLGYLRTEVTAAAGNVRLHREAAHKLTLEKEVDLASAVQLALVPLVAEGVVGRVSWVGHYRPAGQAGSDFWWAYDLGDDRVLVVIGDVVGSGLAASMISAVAKSCCDTIVQTGGAADPGLLLAGLNRALWRPSRPIHMTCFAAIFDPARGAVSYANAGHELPYHVRSVEAAQAVRGDRLGVLAGSAPMLGDAADVRYQVTHRPLAAGDSVLLYTDGLTEATNGQRAPFGERRLQRALAAAADLEPHAARDKLLATVDEFRAGTVPTDDEALVLVRIG